MKQVHVLSWLVIAALMIAASPLALGAEAKALEREKGGDIHSMTSLEQGPNSPIFAEFNGIIIDLNDDDWQGATDCINSFGRWQCFSTNDEADEYANYLDAQGPVQLKAEGVAVGQCSTWALLFQNINYNQPGWNAGRVLRYRDKGFWQNLPLFFQANTSSVQAPPDCNLFLAQGQGGFPPHAGITMGASVPDLRTITHQLPPGQNWNDRARSICLSGQHCPPPR